jgi:predicted transcriptional regulator
MIETTFTFRVDEALKAAFTDAARAHDRPGSQLLREFMRDYVEKAEHDAWFRAEIEQGQRELADPTIEPIPHEQLLAEWEAERAGLLARMAPAKRMRRGSSGYPRPDATGAVRLPTSPNAIRLRRSLRPARSTRP